MTSVRPGDAKRRDRPPGEEQIRRQLRALVRRGVTWPAERRPGPATQADAEHHTGVHALPPGTQAGAQMRRAAVLMLFGPRHGTPHGQEPRALTGRDADTSAPHEVDLLLVKRSVLLRHHPGEVALPGGGMDATDPDAATAALRETWEETGAHAEGIEVIGELAPVTLMASRNVVTPVVAWWHTPVAVFAADPTEIDQAWRVPVTELASAQRRVRAEFHFSNDTPGRAGAQARRATPGVELDDALMWGFTGIVVNTVLGGLGWVDADAWQQSRAVDVALWRTQRQQGR